MADQRDSDEHMEDEYDEEADSDFSGGVAEDEVVSSSSDEEAVQDISSPRPRKRQKVVARAVVGKDIDKLDSGDEETMKEQTGARRKQRRKSKDDNDADEENEQGWRAKTRAMHDRDKEEKKKSKLANIKGSSLDVNKIWEDMNKSGGPETHPQVIEEAEENATGLAEASANPTVPTVVAQGQENLAMDAAEEMITIKRPYRFAGELLIEEKTVRKSSPEAQLWLSQQSSLSQNDKNILPNGQPRRVPLRKISRFDPNYNNTDAFKGDWRQKNASKGGPDGPKLNTVEKSRMDWDQHVDQEGLKEELDVAKKAKGGFIQNKQFLDQVDQKREEEARLARLKS